jgi:hypothetical protein
VPGAGAGRAKFEPPPAEVVVRRSVGHPPDTNLRLGGRGGFCQTEVEHLTEFQAWISVSGLFVRYTGGVWWGGVIHGEIKMRAHRGEPALRKFL